LTQFYIILTLAVFFLRPVNKSDLLHTRYCAVDDRPRLWGVCAWGQRRCCVSDTIDERSQCVAETLSCSAWRNR